MLGFLATLSCNICKGSMLLSCMQVVLIYKTGSATSEVIAASVLIVPGSGKGRFYLLFAYPQSLSLSFPLFPFLGENFGYLVHGKVKTL